MDFLLRILDFFEASLKVFVPYLQQFISANDGQLVISNKILVSKETVVLLWWGSERFGELSISPWPEVLL